MHISTRRREAFGQRRDMRVLPFPIPFFIELTGPGCQQHQISRYEQSRVHDGPRSVPPASRGGPEAVLQRRHGVAGLVELVETDGRVGELYDQEYGRVDPVVDGGLDDDGDPYHDGHGSAELIEEETPLGYDLLG